MIEFYFFFGHLNEHTIIDRLKMVTIDIEREKTFFVSFLLFFNNEIGDLLFSWIKLDELKPKCFFLFDDQYVCIPHIRCDPQAYLSNVSICMIMLVSSSLSINR